MALGVAAVQKDGVCVCGRDGQVSKQIGQGGAWLNVVCIASLVVVIIGQVAAITGQEAHSDLHRRLRRGAPLGG